MKFKTFVLLLTGLIAGRGNCGNATVNFWRSVENLSIVPVSGITNVINGRGGSETKVVPVRVIE